MNCIVCTTINPPTEAIKKFDALPDWKLIVVGDLTTPEYHLERGTYLSFDDQKKYDKKLSDALGWNTLARRNIGILMAYESGADVIALVDDDNIPYDSWGKNLMLGKMTEVRYIIEDNLPVFDPIGATGYGWLWHRGFPLEYVSKRNYQYSPLKKIMPDIQADFWDGDPDIDAVCRMEYMPNCDFLRHDFPIMSNKMSPFNSQNTFILRDVIPHYFLYPDIGRMDDIWASYYVQVKGFRPVYGAPSVRQVRNKHNLIEDMKKEYLGYENNARLIADLLIDPERIKNYVPPDSTKALNLYRRHFDRSK